MEIIGNGGIGEKHQCLYFNSEFVLITTLPSRNY